MSGGQFVFAIVAAGLGFVGADALDRFLATYDPSAYNATSGKTLPTDRFTGGNGTMANTLNIAAPPSILRIGAGVGATALPLVAAVMVKQPMLRSGLQGAAIGAGVKLFSSLWNAYVIGNVLKPAAGANPLATSVHGLRLYPAEITAQLNLATAPPTMASPFNPGLARAPAPAALGRPASDVGPVAQPRSAPRMTRGLADDPTRTSDNDGENCGCLGDRLPMALGLMVDAA